MEKGGELNIAEELVYKNVTHPQGKVNSPGVEFPREQGKDF